MEREEISPQADGSDAPRATWADHVMCIGSVILVLSLLSVVMLQVVSRYLLSVSPMWVEELPGYILIWLTALGACLATRDSSHARIEVLADSVPTHFKRVLSQITAASAVIILLLVVYYGVVSTLSASKAQSVTMWFSLAWAHAAIPTMAAVCIAFIIANVRNERSNLP